MLVKVFAAAIKGVDAIVITIEVNCSRGIKFFLVGLPDVSVKESHERIVSSMEVNGIKFPRNQILVNMAPASIKKEGASYDLPLAIGILAASGKICPDSVSDYMMIGELSLDGSLKPVRGILPIAMKAKEDGFKGIILPEENTNEAAVVAGIDVYGVKNILQVIDFFNGKRELEKSEIEVDTLFRNSDTGYHCDFSEVRGQENVKRAMEVASAGGHNILMVGPPGAGKSMMAKRLPTILPPLTLEESIETTKIHSVAGKLKSSSSLITVRPFRSPHHSVSVPAMIGGGTVPQPGEISLAHNGVLFLDELPEFPRAVLEVMRQPLEDRKITIARSRFSFEYPAGVMLVASMNPCPCGYYNHPTRPCICKPYQIQKYLGRISGPLLDRIDIQVEIVPVPFEKISAGKPSESSASIRERVVRARQIQLHRFAEEKNVYCNAQMQGNMIRKYACPDAEGMQLLKRAMEKFDLSARAYDKILKVSRTIADLDSSQKIMPCHLAEAIGYRNLDRENWVG